MIGKVVGKYRILERVGRGGMGTVYRAIDETLHREVAIKILNTELHDPGLARRLRTEAVALARLSHPGIAMVYELFEHEGQWLMVMEFVRGETLEHMVARRGALPVTEAAEICIQTLTALSHAHLLGVVHRDLKPANLMIGELGTVKITDFGIARVAGTEHLTNAGFTIGTPAYMAPEQVLGQETDARADLYAMGVVLYQLATGKLPFRGDTPMQMAQSRLRDQPTPVRSVRQELPAWLGLVLDIALSRAPARRYQTAQLFCEALRRGLADLPFEAPATGDLPPELVLTAPPNSMPVATMPVRPPSRPPEDAMPTMISGGPGVPPPSGRRVLLAGGAGLLLVGILGGWMFVGPDAPASTPPTAPASSAAAAPDAPPVAVAPGPEAGDPSAIRISEGSAEPPAPVASPAPDAVALADRSPVPAAPPPAALPPPSRARAAADPAVAFDRVRALVVSGRNSQEQPAVLNFFNGQLSLVLQGSRTTLAAMPYREITRATYVHARSPKWDATLASPPENLGIPGGFFRTGRHWLALQSASTYLILRLDDADWRQLIDTFTARTGVPVQSPAG